MQQRQDKVLGAFGAEIGFRGSEACPIGGNLGAFAFDRNQVARQSAAPAFGEQLLDHLLRALVLAFAKVAVAKAPCASMR